VREQLVGHKSRTINSAVYGGPLKVRTLLEALSHLTYDLELPSYSSKAEHRRRHADSSLRRAPTGSESLKASDEADRRRQRCPFRLKDLVGTVALSNRPSPYGYTESHTVVCSSDVPFSIRLSLPHVQHGIFRSARPARAGCIIHAPRRDADPVRGEEPAGLAHRRVLLAARRRPKAKRAPRSSST